jgi:hypothetical protein
LSAVRATGARGDAARAIARQVIDGLEEMGGAPAREYLQHFDAPREYLPAYQAAAAELGDMRYQFNPGSMYEVQINADPASLLDWDAPLSEQSPAVLGRLGMTARNADELHTEALRIMDEGNALAGRPGGWMDFPERRAQIDQLNNELDRIAPGITGAEFYRGGGDPVADLLSSMGRGDPAAASAQLREAGIPGIRYLDAGSRGAGQGSRNFVIFDDRLIEILRRYGIGTAAVGGGWQLTQDEAAQTEGLF